MHLGVKGFRQPWRRHDKITHTLFFLVPEAVRQSQRPTNAIISGSFGSKVPSPSTLNPSHTKHHLWDGWGRRDKDEK